MIGCKRWSYGVRPAGSDTAVAAPTPRALRRSLSSGGSIGVNEFFPAIQFLQSTEKIPHFGDSHEFVIVVVWAVAGPDLFAGFNIFQGHEYNEWRFTDMIDLRVLEVGLSPIYPARREIDAAYVSAVRLAIEPFVGTRALPRALRQLG